MTSKKKLTIIIFLFLILIFLQIKQKSNNRLTKTQAQAATTGQFYVCLNNPTPTLAFPIFTPTPIRTLSLTPTLSIPTPTIITTSAIWWGDADSNGMAAWHAIQCPSGGCDIVNDPEGKYGKVYRATLNSGDTYSGDGTARAEYYGTDLSNGQYLKYYEGDDYYLGWRTRVSNGIYTASGWNTGNFLQLKGDSSCGGPAVGMTMLSGNLTLRSEVNGTYWIGPKMTEFTGSWHDVVLHVHFSKNASTGFLEAWFDGVAQTFIDGSKKYYAPTMCPNDTYIYLKMGYYRGSHTDYPSGTHWFESPRLGTSYSSVIPR